MCKGGDSKAATRDDESEVLIDGRLYDVKGWKHPGGSIVKFLTGNGDASDAFEEFHGRSTKARKVLKSLKSRAAPADVVETRGGNGKPELAKDFAIMREGMKADGLFDPAPMHCAYRLLEVAAMHVGGIVLLTGVCGGGSLLARGAGMVSLMLGQGRCGWLMHEMGHYSFTGNIPLDRKLQSMTYGLGCGMSAGWWRNQHNKHHATPQKLDHDVDLETLPLVCFHDKIGATVTSPAMKAWLSAQGYLFVPLSCLLVSLGWQYFVHPRYILRTKKYDEAAWIALRHFLSFKFVLAQFTWPVAIALWVWYVQGGASYIFTNFAMSHTHLGVTDPDEYLNWVEYSAVYTTNITGCAVTNWWMAMLNYQIEHHLFPSMPQFRHKETSKRTRVLFKKHGLHYDERDYLPCLMQTLRNLDLVGKNAGSKAKVQ